MSKIQERIKEYIDTKGISIREFCRQINVSPSFLSRDAEISSDKVLNIVNAFPEISIDWLITGKGEMIKNSSLDKLEDPPFVPYDIYKDSLEHVKELMQMLKQSQRQLDDLIELHKENQKKTDKGNGAHPDNDAKCADVG